MFNKEKEMDSVIKSCWLIFAISIIIMIGTKFEALPFSEGSYWDWQKVWELLHEVSKGLFCSSVLVLLVEIYHFNKGNKLKMRNKTFLLKNVIEMILILEKEAIGRYRLMNFLERDSDLFSEIEPSTESAIIENLFLRKHFGKWEGTNFIFLSDREVNVIKKKDGEKRKKQVTALHTIRYCI